MTIIGPEVTVNRQMISIADSADLFWDPDPNGADNVITFNNQGSIQNSGLFKIDGIGNSSFTMGGDGTGQLGSSGELRLTDTAAVTDDLRTNIGGRINFTAAGSLTLTRDTTFGGPTIAGPGTVTAQNMTLTVAAASTVKNSADLTVSSATVAMQTGLEFQSSARLTLGGLMGNTFNGSGTAHIASDAFLTGIEGTTLDTAKITNDGTATWSGPLTFANNGKFLNNNALRVPGGANISGSGVFLNTGTITKAMGGVFRVDTASATFTNAGQINFTGGNIWFVANWTNIGTISFQGGESILEGATFTNAGTINQTDDGFFQANTVVNNGTITVANRKLTVLPMIGQMGGGNYTQGSTGVLNLQITGAAANGQLAINGQANLNGTMNITLGNNYQPGGAVPITWTLLNYGSRVGQFATVNRPTPATGAFALPVYNAGSMTITWNPPPALTGINLNPAQGPTQGGTSVSITGSGFTGASAVTFGSSAASSFTVNSDTSITAVAPPEAAGIVNVTVTETSGTSGPAKYAYYHVGAAPVVAGVSPASGSTLGGTKVTITGKALAAASGVSFGSMAAADFTVISDTAILATSPSATAGTVDITVTTNSGTSATSSADHFTHAAGTAPVVSSLGTTSGSTGGGTVVSVTGSGFTNASEVFFGATAASNFTVNSDGSITVVSPPNQAATVDVTVSSPFGTSALVTGDRFTYNLASVPSVSSISPTSGSTAGGTPVKISGSAFTGGSEVLFGSVLASSFTVLTDTTIWATATAQSAGTVDITVVTPSGTSAAVSADQFAYSNGPVPAVTGIAPSSGSTGGGTIVTVTGTRFTGATAVNFGSTAAANFIVLSDTTIQATSPASAAGAVDVTVAAYSGTSSTSSADHFTFNAAAAPAVTAITPGGGSTLGGTAVTITGTGFTGATAVNFGTLAATSFAVLSDTAIVATAPPAAAAGTVHITVVTPSGTSATSSADQFTYSLAAAPAITSVSPSTGGSGGGTVVTILGSGFTGATGVNFGSVPAGSFTVFSDGEVSAVAPAMAAGVWDITVTSPAGTSALVAADLFTVTAAAAPSITSVSPTSGSTAGGTLVTVTGTGFTAATNVLFGSVAAASFQVLSDMSLMATAPSQAAGTVDITLAGPTGTSAVTSSDHFTYNAATAPSVSSISPSSGSAKGGVVVTVTGSNFTGATAVNFGSTPAASFTVLSATTLLATSPAESSGNVYITVTTPSGTSSTGTSSQYTNNAVSPTITGFTPSSGGPGTVVTITGTNLNGINSVTFGSTAATSFTVVSDTVVIATAPFQTPGTATITVSAPYGTVTSSTSFTYSAVTQSSPTVTAISPTTGTTSGGTVVTVTGTNFTTATGVKFGTTAATSFTILSDTQLTATSPPGSAGTVDITVTNSSGTSSTSASDQFTYVSASVPTVTGVSPATGGTAGGTSVTITGTNFTAATAVSFGGVAAASYSVGSSTSITATSPAEAAGTVDITVTTQAGTSAVVSADHFSYTASTVPAITSISPTTGNTGGGNTVTLTGTNFTGAIGVSVGGVAATAFKASSRPRQLPPPRRPTRRER